MAIRENLCSRKFPALRLLLKHGQNMAKTSHLSHVIITQPQNHRRRAHTTPVRALKKQRQALRWRGSLSAKVNENKLGLQSGPGLLLVSGLGLGLGQSCFA